MNTAQIALVRASWDKIAPVAHTAAGEFYERVFDEQPAVRALFRGDLDGQKRALILMLQGVVEGLENPSRLVPAIRAMGRRHVGYGVLPEHYPVVNRALIETLRHHLDDGFTPELEDAWTGALQMLSAIMQNAAADMLNDPSAAL